VLSNGCFDSLYFLCIHTTNGAHSLMSNSHFFFSIPFFPCRFDLLNLHSAHQPLPLDPRLRPAAHMEITVTAVSGRPPIIIDHTTHIFLKVSLARRAFYISSKHFILRCSYLAALHRIASRATDDVMVVKHARERTGTSERANSIDCLGPTPMMWEK
jgi:hypothetical protein